MFWFILQSAENPYTVHHYAVKSICYLATSHFVIFNKMIPKTDLPKLVFFFIMLCNTGHKWLQHILYWYWCFMSSSTVGGLLFGPCSHDLLLTQIWSLLLPHWETYLSPAIYIKDWLYSWHTVQLEMREICVFHFEMHKTSKIPKQVRSLEIS